jgi:hypothetical protein
MPHLDTDDATKSFKMRLSMSEPAKRAVRQGGPDSALSAERIAVAVARVG